MPNNIVLTTFNIVVLSVLLSLVPTISNSIVHPSSPNNIVTTILFNSVVATVLFNHDNNIVPVLFNHHEPTTCSIIGRVHGEKLCHCNRLLKTGGYILFLGQHCSWLSTAMDNIVEPESTRNQVQQC